MSEKIKLYAVYGSLKRGFGNHRLLQNKDAKFIGTTKTKARFSLYSLGGFPGIKNDGKTAVEIEVFDVQTPELESRLDMLEGYGGANSRYNMYNKEVIDTEFGKAFIYTYNGGVSEDRFIEAGKW